MKVVLLNGSPKSNGNTHIMLSWMQEIFEKNGIETEYIQIGGLRLAGCRDCLCCVKEHLGHCVIVDDEFNTWMPSIKECDGLVLGSPTYFTDVTPEMKAFIDRCGRVVRADQWLRRKVGAVVVSQRRMGATHAYDTMNHFLLVNQMIVPGSNYWNMGFGGSPGEVTEDEQAKKTIEVLVENMIWLLKKIHE